MAEGIQAAAESLRVRGLPAVSVNPAFLRESSPGHGLFPQRVIWGLKAAFSQR